MNFLNKMKYILTGLAVINLILLFGFRYEIPKVIKDRFFPDKILVNDQQENDKNEDPSLVISFDEDTLIYDGSEELNLAEGVSIKDHEGTILDLNLYTSIKSTDETNKKIITYSAKDEEGNSAVAERTLLLENYEGPSITVSQNYPSIYDVELNYILDTFKTNELLSAADGYGKNITNAITCSYHVTNDIATEVEITFKITNHLDDTVTETITLPIERTKPLILLTDKSITIKKGDTFDPYEYVISATNEEGEDLRGIIELEGIVDTFTPGTYEITYGLTDSDNEPADPVTLAVTVEE